MLKHLLIAAAVALMPGVALGQAKPVANDQGITVLTGIGFGGLHQPATPVDADHPLPVTMPASAGGATAANQQTQITAAQSTASATGTPADAAWSSGNGTLVSLLKALIAGKGSLASPAVVNPCVRQADGTCAAVGAGAAMPVDPVVRTAATDRGAIVGTTAVTLMPANASRRGYEVQVQSSQADCYINTQATATTDYHSRLIPAGTSYDTPPSHVSTGPVSIVCTGPATPIFARER